MNRTTVSIVLAISCLLAACGNKGELFLETDQAIADEIKELDESLRELSAESVAPSSNVSETDVDAEDTIKKSKKKAEERLQTAE